MSNHSVSFPKIKFGVGVTWIFRSSILSEEGLFRSFEKRHVAVQDIFRFSKRWKMAGIIFALETKGGIDRCERTVRKTVKKSDECTFRNPDSGRLSGYALILPDTRGAFLSPTTVTRVPALSIIESRRSSYARTQMLRFHVNSWYRIYSCCWVFIDTAKYRQILGLTIRGTYLYLRI